MSPIIEKDSNSLQDILEKSSSREATMAEVGACNLEQMMSEEHLDPDLVDAIYNAQLSAKGENY